jgi:hypothetical protein
MDFSSEGGSTAEKKKGATGELGTPLLSAMTLGIAPWSLIINPSHSAHLNLPSSFPRRFVRTGRRHSLDAVRYLFCFYFFIYLSAARLTPNL